MIERKKSWKTKTIRYFEPQTWGPFRVGWQLSRERKEWQQEKTAFNIAICKVAKGNKKLEKKIDLQEMADAQAWSHRNLVAAIRGMRHAAVAEVVDMWETFGHYFKGGTGKVRGGKE